MRALLTPELVEHARHFHEHRAIAERLCADLTVTQFNWRPGPGRWSIAECLVHLNISGKLFGEAILRAVDHARAAGIVGAGPFRYGPLSRWLLRAVEPGNHRRYKAPRKFVPPPTATHEVAPVLDEFRAAGGRWDECLRRADGLHLARVKVPSPAVPLIRFPLGAVFAIQAAHERRHLAQAQRVRAGREGEILAG